MGSEKGHIVVRVVQGVVVTLVLILLVGCLVFQIPVVQTSAAKAVAEIAGEKINGDISIGKVSFVFINRLVLKDVTVCGHGAPAPWGESDTCLYRNPGDTLGHIGKLAVTFSISDIIHKKLGVRRVVLVNGSFRLLTESPDRNSNLTRIFNLPLPEPDKEHKVFPDLFANDIKLTDCSFYLGNPYVENAKEPVPGQMLYNNLKIKNICAHFRDFRTIDGEINCRILDISANESSGAGIEKMTGVLHLGPRGSGMDDMYLKDLNGTVLQAEHLYFNYSSKEEIADWVNSVVMDVNFRETTFNFNSLRYFVPSMVNNNLTLNLKGGEVRGPVADIDARNLLVSLADGKTSVSVNAVLSGIPDMPNTVLNGTVKDTICAGDIPAILSRWSGKPAPASLYAIAEGRNIYQNLTFRGPFKDLGVSGTLKLNAGLIRHDVSISLFTPKGFGAGGTVEVDSLDLGIVLGNRMLGQTDFKLKGSLESGRHFYAGLEYFDIDRIGFKDYEYRDMSLSGELTDTASRLWFVSRDPNFRTNLEANAFSGNMGQSGRYSVIVDVPYVDFKELNLASGTGMSLLRGLKVNADVDYDGDKNALGRVGIADVSYQTTRGSVYLDSLSIVSASDSAGFDVELRSQYADLSYQGAEPLLWAVLRAKDIVIDRQFNGVIGGRSPDYEKAPEPGNSVLKLKTYKIWNLTNVLADGLYLADGTSLTMTLSDKDSLSLLLESGRIAKKNSYLKNVCLRMVAPDSVVNLNLTSSEIKAGNLCIKDNNLDVSLSDGLIDLDYKFLNSDRNSDRPMCLSTDVSLSRDENGFLNTGIGLDSAVVYLNGNKWILDPTNLSIGHNFIGTDGFMFHGSSASLKVNGNISENPDDEMRIELDSLDLSLANNLMTSNLTLGGILTGNLVVKDFYRKSTFMVNLDGTDISFYDNPLGHLKIMSEWDPSSERMNILVKSQYKEKAPLSLTGYYRHQDREVYINSSLDELSLLYAKPFLEGIVRIDGGDLSGDIIFHGSHGKYTLDSENARFHNFAFAPVYTEVPYLMNGGLNFTKSTIGFENVTIEDKKGSRALLTGSVSHDFLRDMKLDLRLNFKDLECLDIKEKDGAAFYGTATASGSVSVTGPVNDILIDAVVKTGDHTSINVPLSNTYAASSNDILVFKDYGEVEVDPYDSLMTTETANIQDKSKIRIKADATLYDDALVTVELDKNLGNIVECHGNARVNLDIDPSISKLDIGGLYTVTSGMARYSFAGIIARDFSIIEGSTINFRGPILNTQLEVGATYHTRTSVATLVADTSSVGTRQNVYASVGLKGNLADPTFHFDIQIPDLDPLTRGRVETAFSSEAKVQKQFMALMLTGSFIPDEQSGVTENSNILYSNVSEMISNHVNNIFRTLNVPLDVGLNYQRTRQKDMFDVNLSYQAFNNRLILNGSVGNGSRNQNWVGNFEAELKMDKRGKFRFSLFTRAADQYTNFIDNSQRNGFGFSFQDEFTRFREIFMSRKKKEAWELDQIEQAKRELLEEQTQKEGNE